MKKMKYCMKHSGDEFWTRYEDVEKCLSRVDLTRYRVYCPCDSEESAFVKYLTGKCKELKYTCDDFRTHDDLFEWADIVITNPPFSLFVAFCKKLVNFNKKFITIGPNIISAFTIEMLKDDLKIGGRVDTFLDPLTGKTKRASCKWYTNVDEAYILTNHKEWKPKTEPDAYYDGIPYFCYQHMPEKWDGEFLVPVTYDSAYEYLNLEIISCWYPKNHRSCFKRLLVRKK